MPLNVFRNPVHPSWFADPFVLRDGGSWYAYGTGPDGDSLLARHRARVFEVRRSPDFAVWVTRGYTLVPPDLPSADTGSGDREFRAPEVVRLDDGFGMYYSTGIAGRGYHVRVAFGRGPEGPFEDAGTSLTPDAAFATDPHPFRDEDAAWYLYYAARAEGGAADAGAAPSLAPGSLMVDRLVAPDRLAGDPRPVLASDQASAARSIGGSKDVAAPSLDGPAVRKRFGRYWCLYSSGGRTSDSAGISVAVADGPLGPFEEVGAGQPSLVVAIPGLRAPGHCSVIEGPDGDDWLVYDAWDDAGLARRMCLDRLTWTPEGPRTDGPTLDDQPVPKERERSREASG